MGVVHKLKSEVVEFIVQQKKENPDISCRALAQLTAETFDIKIAKSSVNNILKQSRLSSKVGRRADKKNKGKKFQIPSGKKEQLRHRVEKHKHFTKPSDPGEPSVKRKKTQKQTTPSTKKPFELESGPSLVHELSRDLPQKKDKAIPPERPSRNQSQGQPATAGPPLPQAMPPETQEISRGAAVGLLLRALLREVTPESFLESFYREHFPGIFQDSPNALFESALIAATGTDGQADGPQLENTLLRMLVGPDQEQAARALWDKIKQTDLTPSLYLQGRVQIDQCFLAVSSLELIMEDGPSLFLSPDMRMIRSAPKGFFQGLGLHKAISFLSQQLVTNTQMLVVQGAAPEEQAAGIIRRFLTVCHGGFSPITKIKLRSTQGQPITSFTTIPKKKRDFLIGLYPGHPDYHVLLEEDKIMPPRAKRVEPLTGDYIKDMFPTKIYVRPSSPTFLKNQWGQSFQIRSFLVFVGQTSTPAFALVTNRENLDPKEAGIRFLRAYPVSVQKDQSTKPAGDDFPASGLCPAKTQTPSAPDAAGRPDPHDLVGYLQDQFTLYIKERMLWTSGPKDRPEEHVRNWCQKWLRVPTGILQKEQYIMIRIYCERENRENLQNSSISSLIKLINNNHFYDEKGRQIYLQWVPR
jgi:hypothetical protein